MLKLWILKIPLLVVFMRGEGKEESLKLAKPIEKCHLKNDVTIVHLSHSQNNIILYLTSALRENLVGTDFI